MKKILFVAFIFFSINSYSQKLQFCSENMVYLNGKMETYVNEYKQLDSFPPFIIENLQILLQNQTGDFASKMTFNRGLILDLVSYFNDFPEDLNRSENIIPQYIFHFNYCDSIVGVHKYELRIGLDNIGQILFFDFPHGYNFKSYSLMPLDKAVQLSDSIVIDENFNYDSRNFHLLFDTLRNDLNWFVVYAQNDTIDENYTLSKFLNFKFSTREHQLLEMYYDTAEFMMPLINIEEEIIKNNNQP